MIIRQRSIAQILFIFWSPVDLILKFYHSTLASRTTPSLSLTILVCACFIEQKSTSILESTILCLGFCSPISELKIKKFNGWVKGERRPIEGAVSPFSRWQYLSIDSLIGHNFRSKYWEKRYLVTSLWKKWLLVTCHEKSYQVTKKWPSGMPDRVSNKLEILK